VNGPKPVNIARKMEDLATLLQLRLTLRHGQLVESNPKGFA